ncbi:MAG: hypothetical protein ACXWUP_14130 [Allosphingosinicella sp.]
MLMLAVQIGILLTTTFAILFGRSEAGKPRPVWSSLALSLAIVAGTSWQIADGREGEDGTEVLGYGALLLLGMALVCALMLIRQRRSLDAIS